MLGNNNSSSPSPPEKKKKDLPVIRHEDFADVLRNIESMDDWESVYHSGDIDVYRKTKGEGSTGYKRHKTRGIIPFPPELVFMVMRDHDCEVQWDADLYYYKLLDRIYYNKAYSVYDDSSDGDGDDGEKKKFGPVNEVLHIAWRSNFPMVKSREYMCYTAAQYEPDKRRFLVAQRSAPHSSIPEVPPSDRVRMEVIYSGLLFEPSKKNPNHCEYWTINELNPGGWIPAAFVNFLTRFGCHRFEKNVINSCEYHIKNGRTDLRAFCATLLLDMPEEQIQQFNEAIEKLKNDGGNCISNS
eukprot:GEZU01016021.1.p1 GENE.GEZU01016021.1~~GEZU01016021.1.p1  ORF type:complete len:298 (+),score=83.75 GEZU01016021.1:242-1135(+)